MNLKAEQREEEGKDLLLAPRQKDAWGWESADSELRTELVPERV